MSGQRQGWLSRRWLRRRRWLRFTREGKVFVGLTLAVGFAAINTGNNLLFLVIGVLLSLIVGSGVLSEVSLHDLEVSRQLPRRLFAGQPCLVGVRLTNHKRRAASFSLGVQELTDHGELPSRQRRGPAQASGHPEVHLLHVPAGTTAHTSYPHTFPRRGRHPLRGFEVSTLFPFGLFRKSRRVVAPAEVLVYPAVRPLGRHLDPLSAEGDRPQQREARRGDFFGLRDYRPGDDPREIYWRRTAQVGRPVVRQGEAHRGRVVAVVLDNRRPGAGRGDQASWEAGVSDAASLAAHYLDRGHAVGLITRTVQVHAAAGEAQRERILRALALLELTAEEAPLPPPHAVGARHGEVIPWSSPPAPSGSPRSRP